MPKERIEDVTREHGKRRLVGHWDAVTRHVVFADALRPSHGIPRQKVRRAPTPNEQGATGEIVSSPSVRCSG
jgi:hypothetical protein